MPIYVYKCEDGHKTEVTQSITAEPLKKCPMWMVKNKTQARMDEVEECGKEVHRVIQKTSFSIK